MPSVRSAARPPGRSGARPRGCRVGEARGAQACGVARAVQHNRHEPASGVLGQVEIHARKPPLVCRCGRDHAHQQRTLAQTPRRDPLENDVDACASSAPRATARSHGEPVPAPHEAARHLGGASIRGGGHGPAAGAPEDGEIPVAGGRRQPCGEVATGASREVNRSHAHGGMRPLRAAHVGRRRHDHALAEDRLRGRRRSCPRQQHGRDERAPGHGYSLTRVHACASARPGRSRLPRR